MNLGELRAAARARLDDTVEPTLWSDEELDRWANNAVREVCIRTRTLKDDAEGNAELCQVAVTAGEASVAIDPVILAVQAAALAGGRCHGLRLLDAASLDRLEPGWAERNEQGTPWACVVGLRQNLLRLFPTPAADDTLRLRVWRMPSEDEQLVGETDEPVLALPNAEDLVHWICYEAYQKKDAEAQDLAAAGRHLNLFAEAFGERPTLREIALWGATPTRVRHAVMF
ncbi:MAG TPA: DUF6682 family protein [Rhodanobacteraceae bacterium]|nr:DUF6682 family protein [Rhodanobacteraceae bacterium]